MKNKFLKFTLLIAFAVMLFAIPNVADAATYDIYTYTISGNEVTITDCDTYASGAIVIPSEIEGKKVTSIGSLAFYDCRSLTSITIPDSVTSIGGSAFYGCISLRSVIGADSVISVGSDAFYRTALYNDSSNWTDEVLYIGECIIKAKTSISGEYTIKSGTVDIAVGAFDGCSSLTSIAIPDSVTSIGSSAFSGCSSLSSIIVAEDNQNYYSIDGVLLSKKDNVLLSFPCAINVFEYTVPTFVTSIGDYAFSDCTSLTSITIPDTVTSIGYRAFFGCTSLTSITIPESVTIIEEGVFRGCTSLEEITLPFIGAKRGMTRTVDSVFGYIFGYSTSSGSDKTYQCYSNSGSAYYYIPSTLKKVTITDETVIPYGAFYNCSNLISITIPDTVTSIEWDAFSRCSNLKGVYISDLTAWYNVEFGNEYSNPLYCAGNLYLNGNLVTELEIPESVTSLGGYAFRYCRSLTSITIPESVTIIEGGVFRGCTSLEEITLPFIGAKRGITGTVDSVFGYIFGYSSSSGSDTTCQYYSDSGSAYYYIPSTLKKVTITDETVIPHGAFYNCVNLTDVTIKGNPTAIMAKAFAGHENLWNITIKSKNVRYANGQMFEITDMPTIYGYEGSTTETYAKNYDLWFVALSEDEEEGYALNADGTLVNGKIVLDITTNKPVTDQALHVALYNDASKLVDYIIVPLTKEYCSFNVVFRDEQNSSFAKVFLWDGLESMTPVTQAKSVTIKR